MKFEEIDVFPINENDDFYEVTDRDIVPCTPRQRSYIYGLLDKAGLDKDDIIDVVNPRKDSIRDFTIAEAGDAIEYLQGITKRW